VSSVLAMSAHTGVRFAEVGFLLILIAGIWIVAGEVPALRISRVRMIVAGAALAAAGVFLIIATRFGHFGRP